MEALYNLKRIMDRYYDNQRMFDNADFEKKHPRSKDGLFESKQNSMSNKKPMSAEELIDKVLSNRKTQGNDSYTDFDLINSEVLEKIKLATGLDLTGFKHCIDEGGVRHIFDHHGDPKTEALRKQVAVTRKDIENIQQVLKNPDSVEYSGLTDDGKPTITFKKKINNLIVCVQEVRKRRRKLAVKTMWKVQVVPTPDD